MSKKNNNRYQQPTTVKPVTPTLVKPVQTVPEAPLKTPEPTAPKIEPEKPARVKDRVSSYGSIFKQRLEEAKQRKAKADAARKAKGKS